MEQRSRKSEETSDKMVFKKIRLSTFSSIRGDSRDDSNESDDNVDNSDDKEHVDVITDNLGDIGR